MRLWKRRLCCHGHGACHPCRESLPGRSPFVQDWHKLQKKKGEICGVGAVLDLQGPPGCPHAALGVGSCLVLSPVEAGCCVIPIFGSLPCPCVSGGAVVVPQGTPTSLCPTLSPPHPTSSGGDEDPGKLVRCRGGSCSPDLIRTPQKRHPLAVPSLAAAGWHGDAPAVPPWPHLRGCAALLSGSAGGRAGVNAWGTPGGLL